MTNNTNTNTTVALIRAILPKDADGICQAVVRKDGHARSGARLEVVVKDPSGSFTWSEIHLGLATKAGKLDFSSFPRKNADVGGYARRCGKRQIIRTGESLLPWQEGNLRYAQGRLERGAHAEPVAFEATAFVKAEERQIVRRSPKGELVQMTWTPELVRGEFRKELIQHLELDPKIGDVELINAVGGDADAGIIPACLLKEVIPEAVLLDLRAFTGWTAVDASTVPGLLTLEAFNARESDVARKRDLKQNGLRKQPVAEGPKQDAAPSEEAVESAVTEVTEEAQG